MALFNDKGQKQTKPCNNTKSIFHNTYCTTICIHHHKCTSTTKTTTDFYKLTNDQKLELLHTVHQNITYRKPETHGYIH